MRNVECGMHNADLKERTRAFALAVIKLVESLPHNRSADVIGKQLLRCGTSVGSNYPFACRARSQAEFVARMGIVEEEADESSYWIGLLVDAGTLQKTSVQQLLGEANELVAIAVASAKTARGSR